MKKDQAIKNTNFKTHIIFTKNGYSNYTIISMNEVSDILNRDKGKASYYELFCNNNYFNTLYLDIDGETEIKKVEIEESAKFLIEKFLGYSVYWCCLTAHGEVQKNKVKVNKKSYHIIFRFIDIKKNWK